LPLSAIAADQLGNELAGRLATWRVANPLIASTGIVSHRDAMVYGVTAGQTDIEASVEGVQAHRTVRVHETPAFDIIYEAGSGDARHLMLWDLSTGNAPRRLHTAVAAFSPAPSPDGQEFAFVGIQKGQGPDGNADLYIVRRDGQVRAVSPSAAFDADPAWSPDGTRLAFTSARANGSLDVFVVDLATMNVTRLTDASPVANLPGSGVAARSPAWSPDGTQLAYSVQATTGSQLWVMSVSGANKRRLTNSTDADDFEPVWSPDGSVIAFAREYRQPKRSMVMTVRPDGTNVTNIDGRVVSVAAVPSYSPDGVWLTTSQARGNNLGAVYAFSTVADAGPRVVLPVEIGGGRHARWVKRP
jgi:Tol biopolymer transport system component